MWDSRLIRRLLLARSFLWLVGWLVGIKLCVAALWFGKFFEFSKLFPLTDLLFVLGSLSSQQGESDANFVGA